MHTFEDHQLYTKHTPEAVVKIVRKILESAKSIRHQISRAALANMDGLAGEVNVQGEEVKKMDLFANDLLIALLSKLPSCAGLASEENEDFLPVNDEGEYIIAFDPLDGSSNIDVNVTVGTIFTIYRRLSPKGSKVTQADFLQSGNAQLAAGFVTFGSSTQLVFSAGKGVDVYCYDVEVADFILFKQNFTSPDKGKTYSINEGNLNSMEAPVKKWIAKCQSKDNLLGKPYGGRYIGSLVADVHRNLLKGGIFAYPATTAAPKGKLRLVYEGNPMAFVLAQAGGKATDGKTDILNLKVESLHQRTPLFIGSAKMVEELLELL